MHTYKARTPFRLYVIPIILVLSLFMFWWAFQHIKERSGLGDEEVTQEEVISQTPGLLPPRADGSFNFAANDYGLVHSPVIPGIEHTKPFYQGNYKAEKFPIPHCVIYNNK